MTRDLFIFLIIFKKPNNAQSANSDFLFIKSEFLLLSFLSFLLSFFFFFYFHANKKQSPKFLFIIPLNLSIQL